MSKTTNRVLSLLNEQGPRLYALLVRITLREDVAEDLMQELFLKLSRRDAILRAGDPVGYSIRAATRLAFDWRRSERRRIDAMMRQIELDSSRDRKQCPLEQREDLQAVLNAIQELSTLCRDIVVMRYLEGRPYEEISEVVGKSAHRTRALCYKSIVRLRSIMSAATIRK